MQYKALQALFWRMTADILAYSIPESEKYIRMKYPQDGRPDWHVMDNIVFLNSSEQDDAFGRQIDSIYKTENGTVLRKRARTRVWQVLFTAYGPEAYEIVNAVKDGVFTEPIHRLLGDNGVYLIPDLPICRQSPELYAGHWWNRWDLTLHFNELYEMTPEDVGHIDSVDISLTAQQK